MKVAFIITGLGLGGAEKQVCDLCDSLFDLGHEVLLISLSKKIIVNPARNIKIVTYDMGKNPLSFLSVYIKIHNLIRTFSPDVVHSHMVHANIFSRLLRLTTKMPKLICTAHNKNEGGKLRMFLYRITDSLADLSTNVSQEAVDDFLLLKASTKQKMIAVYNGIDLEKFTFNTKSRINKRKFLNLSTDTLLFMSVGRLTEAKDYPNLLTAFSTVVRENTDKQIELAIIGVGPLQDELVQLAHDLDIHNKVHWLGMQNDVEAWLSASDLFLLSSAWEGFGLVVAEAMSCLRPVIATNSGGVAEVLGNTLYLVPVKNPEALSSKIEEFLELSEHSKLELIEKNRKHVESLFSMDTICQQWLAIYSRKI